MKKRKLTTQEKVEFLDSFCKNEMNDMIKQFFTNVAQLYNAEDVIMMKREKIAATGIWRSLKKHYALLVADEEGTRYDPPELILKGTQFVSTSIPFKCKQKYDEIIHLMLRADDPHDNSLREQVERIIDSFRDEFKNMPLEEICEPVSVNNLDKYIDAKGYPIKGAPFNVKAANAYNVFLRNNNLIEKGFTPIQNGTKIKVMPLKKNNPYNASMFGFVTQLPPAFDERFINYEEMYDKNFLKYVTELFKEIGIGWNLSESGNPVPDDAF